MCHTCITDELCFHEIHIKARMTLFCCVWTPPKTSCFSLGTASSIVKIHLLLNWFGELCLCPKSRWVRPMLEVCCVHARETLNSEVDEKSCGFSCPVVFFFSFLNLWIFMAVLFMGKVHCKREWSRGHPNAVLGKPGHKLWCLCLCV